VPSNPRGDATLSSRSIPYHATSNNPHNTQHNLSSTYQALTPQVFHEHNQSQLSLHLNPTYLHTVHIEQINQVEAGFDALGVDLPDSIYSRVVQHPVGMTPIELFEAQSYPYQQHNSYRPILPQHHDPHHEAQYGDVARHSKAQYHQYIPSPTHTAASNPGFTGEGQNIVYYAPQQEYYIPTTTHGEAMSPGNDLAAVGTQFDGHVSSGYAQTF
jgi:hypothetical protein